MTPKQLAEIKSVVDEAIWDALAVGYDRYTGDEAKIAVDKLIEIIESSKKEKKEYCTCDVVSGTGFLCEKCKKKSYFGENPDKSQKPKYGKAMSGSIDGIKDETSWRKTDDCSMSPDCKCEDCKTQKGSDNTGGADRW